MFYLDSTLRWMDEVISKINLHQLNPMNSIFMIAFFNSMDFEIVQYFKSSKDRISSVSGENFHIFTPLIYENNLVPDGDWRFIKQEFKEKGIPISTVPTFVFFKLENYGDNYEPLFFAGYEVRNIDGFNDKLKNTIELCIEEKNIHILIQKLNIIYLSPNLIKPDKVSPELLKNISNKLNIPKIFISHSTDDKPFVHKLIKSLSTEKINFWLDENEIKVGDDLIKTISLNLKDSDYLLLVISRNSANSPWVHTELSQFIGFKNGKKILPILIGSGIDDFPKHLRNELIRIKYLDFSNEENWEMNIKKLIKTIVDD